MEDYDKLWRIGAGGQGKVHRVKHRRTGKEHALKQIMCRDNHEMNFALHEIKVLTQIKHQYIINFHDFFIHKDRYQQISICLVMELCENGDLSDRIKDARRKRVSFDEGRVTKWMNQIYFGLNYLHEQEYIHRDIKPTNIFMTHTDDSIRLGDFGLSRNCDGAGRKTVVGTPYYFAPELMLHQRYTNKVDIWGVGVVVLELCTLRERPINSQLLQGPQVLSDAEHEIVSRGFSTRLAQACRAMLAKDPQHRPTARDILRKWAPEADLEKYGVVQAPAARPRSRSGGPALHGPAAAAAVAARQAPPPRPPAADRQEKEQLMRQLAARDDEVRQLRKELERMRLLQQPDAAKDRAHAAHAAHAHRAPLNELQANHRPAARDAVKVKVTPAVDMQPVRRAAGAPRPATADAGGAERGRERDRAKDAGAPPPPRAAFAAIDDPTCLLADITGSSAENSGDDVAPAEAPRPAAGGAPERRVRKGESIQAAVDAAPAGARVVIDAGTYPHPLHVGKPLTIVAADPRDRPVIEVCNKTVVTVAAAAELDGLVIRQRRAGDGSDGKWVACDFRQGAKGAVLARCDLSSDGGACVTVHRSAEPHVKHCTIHHGAQAGVYMFDGARGIIEHNDIYNNTYAALLLKRGADPIIRNNRIHAGRDTGVFVCHESKGNIEDNEIFGNGGSGIVVKGGGAPTIQRNQIHSNKQAGVFVCDRGGGVIRDNDIARNVKAGVLIKTHADPVVQNNTIHAGQETGVYCFEQGNGVVRDNVISGNQNAGVLITTGGRLIVQGNTIKENKYEGVWVCNDGRAVVTGNDLRGNAKGAMDVDESCRALVESRDNLTS